MSLMNQIVERAKANKQRIVLPEGTEERTLKAANQLLTDEVADLILIGNPEEIAGLAKEWGLEHIGKATIIDPANHPKKEEYAQLLWRRLHCCAGVCQKQGCRCCVGRCVGAVACGNGVGNQLVCQQRAVSAVCCGGVCNWRATKRHNFQTDT